MFLFRLLTYTILAILILVAIAASLYAIVWTINRVVQITANALGYEVRDFFAYIKDVLPKRKRRRK